ncbi:hypothetical protein BpHYR1_040637 [Brachionus plicatilis]|uniref:Uncharacterized protein n=1 Tax=Brachionus plicatilis TaxID=10195 RepID=A0A3M7RYS9_BRAPC|nr:hypothetical protein BpHYR1_040637 [Brachionus plicatilis]
MSLCKFVDEFNKLQKAKFEQKTVKSNCLKKIKIYFEISILIRYNFFVDLSSCQLIQLILRVLSTNDIKNRNNFLNSNKKNLFKFVYVQGVDIVQKK